MATYWRRCKRGEIVFAEIIFQCFKSLIHLQWADTEVGFKGFQILVKECGRQQADGFLCGLQI
ncbi:hypothetical protein BO996_17660 [Delftia sp. HK171]|nr:hypothetical protein BO996_17660 [Delftia sp. HK171]